MKQPITLESSLPAQYLLLCTDIHPAAVESLLAQVNAGTLHPMDFKKRMAYEITRLYHGEEAAHIAAAHFEAVVQRHEAPVDMPEVLLAPGASAVDVLVQAGLVQSRGEGKRVIEQKGVTVNGALVSEPYTPLAFEDGAVLRKGKRQYVRLRVQP